MLRYFTRQELILDVLLVAAVIFACVVPRVGERLIGPLERWGSRIAANRWVSILAVAAASLLLRLSLWPFGARTPVPHIHDEFSYLLAADTFAHGRLTNPTPATWMFFEAFHVNQWPTYMSKYPPAQGAVLALGQLLGNPWVGVLLSIAVMCGAAVWALQGWLPRRWALLGGVLAVSTFSAAHYWTETYFGGAIAATGGALVLGALPRMLRRQRVRDSLVLGLGIATLALSRPYEGFFFSAPVLLFLAGWLLSRRSPSWRITLPRVVVPAAVVVLLLLAFISFYNWRVTGTPLHLPYMVNDQQYMRAPHFFWQQLGLQRSYRNPQFDQMYNGYYVDLWKLRRISASWPGIEHGVLKRLIDLQDFFLPRQYALAVLLALPWLLRDRKAIALAVPVAACVLAGFAVVWYEPHYFAPIVIAVLAIVLQSLRHLRQCRWSRRPVGIAASRAIVLFALCMLPMRVIEGLRQAGDPAFQHMRERQTILRALENQPGRHLVLVRYSPNHNIGWDWVYNRADIDNAKVVWAREIPGADLRPLLDYSRGRIIWEVDADDASPQLRIYEQSSSAHLAIK